MRNLLTLLKSLFPRETLLPVGSALLVGLGVGLGSVAYQSILAATTAWVWGPLRQTFSFLGIFAVVLFPALGGLLAGPLLYYFARDAKGHGVPEVMEAVVLHGGRISPAIVVNAIASIFTIGFGGSAGRVAPVVQIGSAWGATVGRALRLSPERLRNLVACGAAAGIAATFNTPIAGVFFALEVILGEIGAGSFATIVIAAVTGNVVHHAFYGDAVFFVLPTLSDYTLGSSVELLLYVGLGLCTALIGVLFVRSLGWVVVRFSQWETVGIFGPAVGGLFIGWVALAFPQALGVGTSSIEQALAQRIPWEWMLALALVKIVATSFTLGSGGAGGIFAPLLFVGAMVGGAYGYLVDWLFSPLSISPGAYALVGMAAIYAAAARAPITALLILFEMTRNYQIILPLMLATVVSLVIAVLLEPESIYTRKLVDRGIDLKAFQEYNLMRAITVEEAMTPFAQLMPLHLDVPLVSVEQMLGSVPYRGFVVLDNAERLFGLVTLTDIRRIQTQPDWRTRTVAEVCSRELRVAFPDENLEDALEHFGAQDVGQIPVVSRRDRRKLLGMLRRDDIIRAYARATRDIEERRYRTRLMQMQEAAGERLVSFTLKREDAAVGRRIMELHLPQDALVISVRRGRQTLVARGGVYLEAGDTLTVLTHPEHQAEILRLLTEGSPETEPASTLRTLQIALRDDAEAIGKRVAELGLPSNCLLVGLRREGRTLLPRGDTVLHLGDQLTVLVDAEDSDAVWRALGGEAV